MTTTPDPRPKTTRHGGMTLLQGWRCGECQHPCLWAVEQCPRCGGPTAPASFGPRGIVWSSTVVRVPIPGRTPPYGMAYVDLEDGPRVLAHVAGEPERLVVGTSVVLRPANDEGDLIVEAAL